MVSNELGELGSHFLKVTDSEFAPTDDRLNATSQFDNRHPDARADVQNSFSGLVLADHRHYGPGEVVREEKVSNLGAVAHGNPLASRETEDQLGDQSVHVLGRPKDEEES